MSENPDNGTYIDLGPQGKQKAISDDTESANYGKEVELNMDSRYLIPTTGMLRFVERGVPTENPAVLKNVRILQQYQWSMETGIFDWYDIPLVIE